MVKTSNRQLLKNTLSTDSEVQVHTNLPPNVTGPVYSHLTLTIGRILGIKKNIHSVCVKCKWWGEDGNGIIFRGIQCNLKQVESSIKSVSYDVCCNLKQFSSYLNDMGFLILEILKIENDSLIGTVKIADIKFLSSSSPIRGIFPVMSPKGQEIAKLQIYLSLENFSGSINSVSDLVKPIDSTYKENNAATISVPFCDLKKNEQCNQKGMDMSNQKTGKESDPYTKGIKWNLESQSDDLITALIEKGQQLRKAMIISMLDTEIDSNLLEEKQLYQDIVPQNRLRLEEIEIASNTLMFAPENSTAANVVADLITSESENYMSIVNTFEEDNDSINSLNTHAVLSEDDDPIHDEKIIHHLFYNRVPESSVNLTINEELQPTTDKASHSVVQTISQNKNDRKSHAVNNDSKKVATSSKIIRMENDTKKLPSSQLSPEKLLILGHVQKMKIAIGSLILTGDFFFEKIKRKDVSSFVLEYEIPPMATNKTSHVVSSFDSPRVVAKCTNDPKVFLFNHQKEFPVTFDGSLLKHWLSERIIFKIYLRFKGQQITESFGTCSLPLLTVLKLPQFIFQRKLDILSVTSSDQKVPPKNSVGKLEVSIELDSENLVFSQFVGKTKKGKKNNYVQITEKEMLNYSDDKENFQVPYNSPENDLFSRSTESFPVIKHIISEWNKQLPTLQILLMIPEGRNLYSNYVFPKHKSKLTLDSHSLSGSLYLMCRMFWCKQAAKSKVCRRTSNPQFDLLQVSSVTIDSTFVEFAKDNIMVVEVWQSNSEFIDQLVGISKLPLHQFYLSLCLETHFLLKSQKPVLAVDNYVPVIDLFSGSQCGQLKVLLALGTVEQIRNLQQQKLEDNEHTNIETKSLAVELNKNPIQTKENSDESADKDDNVVHIIEVCIKGIHNFKILESFVYGETDCFVEYLFPVQQKSICQEPAIHLEAFHTCSLLCAPDLIFEHVQKHTLHLPKDRALQKELVLALIGIDGSGSTCGIPFKIWCRQYYPNVMDKIVAQANLPISKFCTLLTLKKGHSHAVIGHSLPLLPVNFCPPEMKEFGSLDIVINYRIQSKIQSPVTKILYDSTLSSQVFIAVHLRRICGLQSAIFTMDDDDMPKTSLNIFVKIQLSFLSKKEEFISPVFKQSFSPELNCMVDFPCNLLMKTRNESVLTLAEMLQAADAVFEIWHKQECIQETIEEHALDNPSDILLGICKVPLLQLLIRKTGKHGWFSVISFHHNSKVQNPETPRCLSRIIGGLELAINFTHSDDLDKVTSSAISSGYSVKKIDEKWNGSTSCSNQIIFITVDFLCIQHSPEIVLHQFTEGMPSLLCLQYKLHDVESVSSNLYQFDSCSYLSETINFKYHNQHEFEASSSFGWYLREDQFEIQLWKSHDTEMAYPDYFIGSAFIDLCGLVSDWSKTASISGEYPLFKVNSSNMGGSYIRVHILRKPALLQKNFTPVIEIDCSKNQVKVCPFDHNKTDAISTFNEKSKGTDNLNIEKEVFKSHILIERAAHLPLVTVFRSDHSVKPNCYVSCHTVDNISVVTPVVEQNQWPQWKWEDDISLNKQLLTQDNKGLIFKLWHKPASFSNISNQTSDSWADKSADRVIGFVSVDLSPLIYGLKHIYGWYNVINFAGQCQGQIKIGIIPLENLSDIKSPRTLSSHKSSVGDIPSSTSVVSVQDNLKEEFPMCQCNDCLSGQKHSYLIPQNQTEHIHSVKSEHSLTVDTMSNLSDLYCNLNQQLADLDQLHIKMKQKLLAEEKTFQSNTLDPSAHSKLSSNGFTADQMIAKNKNLKTNSTENKKLDSHQQLHIPKLNLDEITEEVLIDHNLAINDLYQFQNFETRIETQTSPFISAENLLHKGLIDQKPFPEIHDWLEKSFHDESPPIKSPLSNTSPNLRDWGGQTDSNIEVNSNDCHFSNNYFTSDEIEENIITPRILNDILPSQVKTFDNSKEIKQDVFKTNSPPIKAKLVSQKRCNTAKWLVETLKNKKDDSKSELKTIELSIKANKNAVVTLSELDLEESFFKCSKTGLHVSEFEELKKLSPRRVHFAREDHTEIIQINLDNEIKLLSPIEECEDSSESIEIETAESATSSKSNGESKKNLMSFDPEDFSSFDEDDDISDLLDTVSKHQYRLSNKNVVNYQAKGDSESDKTCMERRLNKNATEKCRNVLHSDYSKENIYNHHLKETRQLSKKSLFRPPPRIPEYFFLQSEDLEEESNKLSP